VVAGDGAMLRRLCPVGDTFLLFHSGTKPKGSQPPRPLPSAAAALSISDSNWPAFFRALRA
jgi:hypothetical protein